nr:MAG TPA: hypothetical protein [Caudoviricetes sp.]
MFIVLLRCCENRNYHGKHFVADPCIDEILWVFNRA